MVETMIEVFKTNLQDIQQSLKLLSKLRQCFSKLRFNFDLEDCNKILRVEGKNVHINKITKILLLEGYLCELLED